jgi:hypothetical protein
VRRVALTAVVLLLAGCGSEPSGPQDVVVEAGPQRVEAAPTQYCVDGEGQRYDAAPPYIEVSPDTTIRLTVPDAVAERGWSVQVFDEGLEELLGEAPVDTGEAVLELNSNDVVPPAFYLVVVEDAVEDCEGFSGAWPIGFLRAGGNQGGTATESTPPAPQG